MGLWTSKEGTITGEQGEIGNKEVLGPQWFDVQGEYMAKRASGTMSSLTPCTKVREPPSTVRLFRNHATNLLKGEMMVPCYRALPRPHGRSTTQVGQARTSPSGRIEGVERHKMVPFGSLKMTKNGYTIRTSLWLFNIASPDCCHDHVSVDCHTLNHGP